MKASVRVHTRSAVRSSSTTKGLLAAASVCIWALTSTPVHAEITFLNAWGTCGQGDGAFNYPWCVAVAPTGTVYVGDWYNNRIQLFDRSGNFIAKWGASGTGDGEFAGTRGVAVDYNGNVFVADYLNDRIQKFDPNGNFITKWGSNGAAAGQFCRPWGVATGPAGEVYVTDSYNNRVQKFDNNGNFLLSWGSPGHFDGDLDQPHGVAVDPLGNILVADSANSRIQEFDSAGHYVGQWPTCASYLPDGIGVSQIGSVFVAAAHSVQKYDQNRVYLTSQMDGFGFYYAQGVAVSPTGEVYVADQNHHLMERFFDSDEWTSGTNEFTNAAVGPGQILGVSQTLTSAKTLIVTNKTGVEPNGTLELAGGMLTTGSYQQRLGGTLKMGISSTAIGGYDHIEASGTLTFDGVLHVDLRNGFQPQLGDSFDLFDGTLITGQFSSLELPVLVAGVGWDTTGLYTTGTLAVIPEPATAVLLPLSVVALIHRRRK